MADPILMARLLTVNALPTYGPRWLGRALIALTTVFFAVMLATFVYRGFGHVSNTRLTYGNSGYGDSTGLRDSLVETAEYNEYNKVNVAVMFAGFILAVSLLFTVVSFFVYLFSKDKERSERAGKMFSTSWKFVAASGNGMFAFLGFKT